MLIFHFGFKKSMRLSQLLRQLWKIRQRALNPQQPSKLRRLMQRPLGSQRRQKKRRPEP